MVQPLPYTDHSYPWIHPSRRENPSRCVNIELDSALQSETGAVLRLPTLSTLAPVSVRYVSTPFFFFFFFSLIRWFVSFSFFFLNSPQLLLSHENRVANSTNKTTSYQPTHSYELHLQLEKFSSSFLPCKARISKHLLRRKKKKSFLCFSLQLFSLTFIIS